MHSFRQCEIMQNKFGILGNYAYLCIREIKEDMKTIETTYIGKADTTVDTIQLTNGNIAYLHNKDGMTSLIPHLGDLLEFLKGDTTKRLGCFPTENAEEMIDGFEKIFSD